MVVARLFRLINSVVVFGFLLLFDYLHKGFLVGLFGCGVGVLVVTYYSCCLGLIC